MSLKEEIFEALNIKDSYNGSLSRRDFHFKCRKLKKGFELEFGQMYESHAEINFKTLSVLSRIVGTEEIDIDDYANSGCESCDFGSDYGHTIQILNPTLRVVELEELCG
jgi:hypothetical protein